MNDKLYFAYIMSLYHLFFFLLINCDWVFFTHPIQEKKKEDNNTQMKNVFDRECSFFYCQDEYFFTSQPVVNDLPVRAHCVTVEEGTVVLMREEDGQASLTTHTALCLLSGPPSLA